MKELLNRVALLTGPGVGDSIGVATFEALALMGADLCVLRDSAFRPLPARLDEIAREHEVELLTLDADLTEAEEVEAAVLEASSRLGPPNILVHFSSPPEGAGKVTDYDPEQWLLMLQGNAYGAFLAAKYVLPHMQNLGGGSIVSVAHISARYTQGMASAHAASMAAVLQFTRSIAAEYGSAGVRANVLLPGDIKTDAFANEARGVASLLGLSAADVMELSANSTLLRRLGQPEEVASLAAFLCTDRASFLTGLAIPVTGGKELPFNAQ